jgi:hypothetical protein
MLRASRKRRVMDGDDHRARECISFDAFQGCLKECELPVV